MNIEIAGFLYTLHGSLFSLQGFETEKAPADGTLTIRRGEHLTSPTIAQTYAHDELLVHQLAEGGWLYESPAHLAPAQMLADETHRTLTLYLPPWQNEDEQNLKAMHMLRTALECRFCEAGVLSLHGAAVSVKGEAVVFTGPSGMGKSTRAAKWTEHLGAEWISGDRPAVKLGSPATLCGVPWDGKEQIFHNVKCPLRVIADVRRSEATYVRRLTPKQAGKLLLSQCFIPMWNPTAAAQTLAAIHVGTRKLPVVRLFCGPTEEAAREAYDILFHHPEKILEAEKDMKIRKGFVLRNVVGESIVMPTGDNVAKFDGAVALNEVSAFLFDALKESISRADLLTKLLSAYDVDEATASADLDEVLKQFEQMGLLDVEG